jgi:hypothetical protein
VEKTKTTVSPMITPMTTVLKVRLKLYFSGEGGMYTTSYNNFKNISKNGVP